jgi:hypothetical protein
MLIRFCQKCSELCQDNGYKTDDKAIQRKINQLALADNFNHPFTSQDAVMNAATNPVSRE